MLKNGTREESTLDELFPLALWLPEEIEWVRGSDVNEVKLENLTPSGIMGVVVMGDKGDKGPIRCLEGGRCDDGEARGGCILTEWGAVDSGDFESDIEEVADVMREDVDWFALKPVGECEK